MKSKSILSDAQSVPAKGSLEQHQEAIQLLRDKGYTWREISTFLSERGIEADHTKIYRFMKKNSQKEIKMLIPSSDAYKNALQSISITDKQKIMLGAHFNALNRTITYTELASAAGYEGYTAANAQYGQLGRNLGDALGFNFADSEDRPGEKFYSSSLGMRNVYASEGSDFELVMHHELSKAISELGWF